MLAEAERQCETQERGEQAAQGRGYGNELVWRLGAWQTERQWQMRQGSLSPAVRVRRCSWVLRRQGRQELGAVRAAAQRGHAAPVLGHVLDRWHLGRGPGACQRTGSCSPGLEEKTGPGRGLQRPTNFSAAVALP